MIDEYVVFQFVDYTSGSRTPASRILLSELRRFLVESRANDNDPPPVGVLILASEDSQGAISEFSTRPLLSVDLFLNVTKSLEVSP